MILIAILNDYTHSNDVEVKKCLNELRNDSQITFTEEYFPKLGVVLLKGDLIYVKEKYNNYFESVEEERVVKI